MGFGVGFADDDDFDLSGILTLFFDFVRDVAAKLERLFVTDSTAVDEDTDFATRIEHEGFSYAAETVADAGKRFDFLVVHAHG